MENGAENINAGIRAASRVMVANKSNKSSAVIFCQNFQFCNVHRTLKNALK